MYPNSFQGRYPKFLSKKVPYFFILSCGCALLCGSSLGKSWCHGVLEGITRQTVIDLAKELNIKVNKKPITIKMLKASEELFATSTAGGVMPITKISGKNINKGTVGDITRKIHKLYWEKHSDPDWSTSINDIFL